MGAGTLDHCNKGTGFPQGCRNIMGRIVRANHNGLFAGIGLKLVDFKLEFGRLYEESGEVRVVLADEISPDSCRLWDIETNDKMDKDRFRHDLGSVEEAYQEVARRLGILPESGDGDIPAPEAVQ